MKSENSFKTYSVSDSDRIQDIAYIGFTIFSLVLMPVYDTWNLSIPVLILAHSMYYGFRIFMPQSTIYQYVGSANYAVLTALLIYEMHGLKEMHFIAFIGSLLLVTYKKWTLQLPLTLIVVVHHSLLAYLENLGYTEVYFTDSGMDLTTFLIHVFLAAVIFFLCGYWAYVFNRNEYQMLSVQQTMQEKDKIVQHNIEIATQIAHGNLDVQINVHENDMLSKALTMMQTNLKIAKQKEIEEKYLNVGLAQAAEIMRAQNQSLGEFADKILKYLVNYTEANQGALFILEEENEEKFLDMKACYAYDRKKYLQKRIELGEGLAGQAFLEQDTIYLTDVPSDYVHISSGLGHAKPRCVILVPLKTNDQVYGVLEMALFKELEPYKINFLNKCAESIAANIASVRTNEQTKKLLELAQKQSEELRNQEEEMRQNLEEMQATQEELMRLARANGASSDQLHYTNHFAN